MPEVLTSVHIEKTAGLSVMSFLESVAGRDRVAFYDPTSNSLTRSSDLLLPFANAPLDIFKSQFRGIWPYIKRVCFMPQRQCEELTIPNDVRVIHGHFKADKFDRLITNPLRATVIRDPLGRMRSHFDHWRSAKGMTDWRIKIPFDSQLQFEDFALIPELLNYQSQALSGKDLSQFDVVGVTDDLDRYLLSLLNLLTEAMGIDLSSERPFKLRRYNQTPKNHKTPLEYADSGFLREFRRVHAEDYHLYQQACLLSNETKTSLLEAINV